MQYVHQIVEAEAPPEGLAFPVPRRDADLEARDAPIPRPRECGGDQLPADAPPARRPR